MKTKGQYTVLLFLIIIAIHRPLSAMELEEIRIHKDNILEPEPLLSNDSFNEIRIDQEIENTEDELEDPPPGFWDGTHAYYDEEAIKKAKYKACKKCLLRTSLLTLCGTTAGIAVNFLGSSIAALIETARSGGNFSQYFEFMLSLSSPEIISFSTTASLLFGGTRGALTSIREMKNPELSEDAAIALDNSTLICSSKNINESFLSPPKTRCKLARFLLPSVQKQYAILQEIDARKPPQRFEYAKIAYKLKKRMLQQLKRDVMRYIFSFFPEKNILLHLVSHLPGSEWSNDVFYITEREAFLLALLKKYHLDDFTRATTLAKKGWCSFEKSDKYPIRINWKYFDIKACPEDFISDKIKYAVRPKAYFPYCNELVRYYQFEEDPAYIQEYEKPSCKKIKKLLILRQQFLEQNHN